MQLAIAIHRRHAVSSRLRGTASRPNTAHACEPQARGYTRRGTFFRTEPRVERWASARLFLGPETGQFRRDQDKMDTELEQIQNTVEGRLHDQEPGVELLALERPASERLRLVIDRPGGRQVREGRARSRHRGLPRLRAARSGGPREEAARRAVRGPAPGR